MTAATAQSLNSLAARLTNPADRETYAGLISYFEALPDHDELFHIVELLGLLSLLGQRLPDALAEAMTEMRELTTAASDYHDQVDARLAALPREIAGGVDPAAIAKGMGEVLRQQLTATGLEKTADLLRNSSREITALSNEISTTLKPVTREYKGMASSISAELEKLTDASERLQNHNAHLFQQERRSGRLLQAAAAMILFLAGGLCGIFMEKRQTTDVLSHVGTQIEGIQTPAVAAVAATSMSHKAKKQ